MAAEYFHNMRKPESISTHTDCSPFRQKNLLRNEMVLSPPPKPTRFSPQIQWPFWICICRSSLLARAQDLGEEPDLPLHLYTLAGSIFWARSLQGLRTPSWLRLQLAKLYCEVKHREWLESLHLIENEGSFSK